MTKIIGIQEIVYALPEGVQRNAEIVDRHGFEEAFIADKLGIEERRVLGEGETVSGIASAAVEALLQTTGVAKQEIELLIVVTQTPDYCLPHVSALVHDAVGLPNAVAAFDIGLGCSGYVYGLAVARAIMQVEEMRRGILVTADAYSRIMDPGDRATAPLFGDGASATLLSDSPVYLIGKSTFGTDGGRHGALIAHGTGSSIEDRQPLYMNGRTIFTFMMREAPNDIRACLKKNGVEVADIDRFVFHQASRYMLQNLSRQMKLDPDKVTIDMKDVGNTTSSTIPIALERQVIHARPKAHRLLLSGFGVGLSWASTVLTAKE